MDKCVTVFTTFPNNELASRVCTRLVKDGIIACANIIPGGQSIYQWDGAVQFDEEYITFMKTTSDQIDTAIKIIKDAHSYDNPCVTVLPIEGGNPDYLKWIVETTAKEKTFEYAGM